MMMTNKKVNVTTNMTMNLHGILNCSENYSTITDVALSDDVPLFCFMIML
jgi:hypothetical protein